MQRITHSAWFKILTGLLSIFGLTFFWAILFGFMDVNEEWTWFPLAVLLSAITSYIVILFVSQYHRAVHLKGELQIAYKNIGVKEAYMVSLIAQLQEITDKIVDHELKMSVKKTVSELTEEERVSDSATSDGNDNQHYQSEKKTFNQSSAAGHREHVSQVSDKVTRIVERLERDTNGRADESLQQLMTEIKEAEVLVANQRLYYNQTVAQYNRAIYALPLAFLRQTLGFKEQELN